MLEELVRHNDNEQQTNCFRIKPENAKADEIKRLLTIDYLSSQKVSLTLMLTFRIIISET